MCEMCASLKHPFCVLPTRKVNTMCPCEHWRLHMIRIASGNFYPIKQVYNFNYAFLLDEKKHFLKMAPNHVEFGATSFLSERQNGRADRLGADAPRVPTQVHEDTKANSWMAVSCAWLMVSRWATQRCCCHQLPRPGAAAPAGRRAGGRRRGACARPHARQTVCFTLRGAVLPAEPVDYRYCVVPRVLDAIDPIPGLV
jgi:hypothetical protein